MPHRPQEVAFHFNETVALLTGIGYQHTVSYEKTKTKINTDYRSVHFVRNLKCTSKFVSGYFWKNLKRKRFLRLPLTALIGKTAVFILRNILSTGLFFSVTGTGLFIRGRSDVSNINDRYLLLIWEIITAPGLTHTLEVAQLSRTMARALGLNEDLSEAIALGHDLGHTPFGHVGEIVLNGILKGTAPEFKNFGDLGGFKHNYQGLRVVDVLEKRYSWNGLNLTSAVREGILKHTRLKRGSISYQNFHEHDLYYDLDHAVTLEGQIVAVCDEIAQRTHDLEDGFRAQYVDFAKVRELDIIKRVEKQARIKFFSKR